MDEVFVRYLHFIGIIILSSALVCEHLLVRGPLNSSRFKQLFVIDTVYGVGALLTLTGGLLLWFAVGKPASFYSSNPLFHIKFTLFIVMGIISIFPTLYFRSKRKSDETNAQLPKYIIILIRVQLAVLLIMPLLGVLVSRGVAIG